MDSTNNVDFDWIRNIPELANVRAQLDDHQILTPEHRELLGAYLVNRETHAPMFLVKTMIYCPPCASYAQRLVRTFVENYPTNTSETPPHAIPLMEGPSSQPVRSSTLHQRPRQSAPPIPAAAAPMEGPSSQPVLSPRQSAPPIPAAAPMEGSSSQPVLSPSQGTPATSAGVPPTNPHLAKLDAHWGQLSNIVIRIFPEVESMRHWITGNLGVNTLVMDAQKLAIGMPFEDIQIGWNSAGNQYFRDAHPDLRLQVDISMENIVQLFYLHNVPQDVTTLAILKLYSRKSTAIDCLETIAKVYNDYHNFDKLIHEYLLELHTTNGLPWDISYLSPEQGAQIAPEKILELFMQTDFPRNLNTGKVNYFNGYESFIASLRRIGIQRNVILIYLSFFMPNKSKLELIELISEKYNDYTDFDHLVLEKVLEFHRQHVSAITDESWLTGRKGVHSDANEFRSLVQQSNQESTSRQAFTLDMSLKSFIQSLHRNQVPGEVAFFYLTRIPGFSSYPVSLQTFQEVYNISSLNMRSNSGTPSAPSSSLSSSTETPASPVVLPSTSSNANGIEKEIMDAARALHEAGTPREELMRILTTQYPQPENEIYIRRANNELFQSPDLQLNTTFTRPSSTPRPEQER